MKFIIFLVVSVFVVVKINAVLNQKCPDGAPIYAWGIDENGKKTVVGEHNRIRQMIMDGTVPNQPRGKNIKLIERFDEKLSFLGRRVSQACKMNHVIASDGRWNWVGQNLYISWSSVNLAGQNWAAVVDSWYKEHKDFKYPNTSTGVTGHYTQIIWHNLNVLGCDFIQFYDNATLQYPYAKLYTCNYGPGGNYIGQAPYQLA